MQIKNINVNFLKKPWIIGLMKVIILAGCGYFILSKVGNRSGSLANVDLPENFYSVLVIVALLMPLNWFLEAYRWKLSIAEFEEIEIKESFRIVLSGLALNWILPFTSGDLFVRVVNQKDRFQSTSAAVLNRGLMMSFTLLIGGYGISFLSSGLNLNRLPFFILIFGTLIAGWFFKKMISRFLMYFHQLSIRSIFRLTSISLLRYILFVFQFYLILHSFLPELATEFLIAGIGWIFFVRSVFPLFFGGVGVREASGILFFQNHVADLMLVLSPVFIIWIVNTVVPSIVGMIILVQSKSHLKTFKISDGVVE